MLPNRILLTLSLALTLDIAPPLDDGRTPVLDVDFADPFILTTGSGLYAYATNTQRHGARLNVQVSHAGPGMRWTPPSEAMPELPPWALRERPDIWAPEVLETPQGYVLYFSARHATLRRRDGLTLCVGAARASQPEGPFTPEPMPLTCGGRDGVIDPSPFRAAGELWLYVKTDGNCCGAPTRILAQRLSSNGLGLLGAPVALTGVTNDKLWEGKVVEAPQMVAHAGRYYLFYSANDYASGAYAVGYARCRGPAGPCQDAPENPILRSGDALVGPGHQSLFQLGGRTYLAHHGWRQAKGVSERRRALYIRSLTWTAGGPKA